MYHRPTSVVSALAAGMLAATGTTLSEETRMRKPLPTPSEIAQLPPDGGPEFNRLIFSQSPYLLQHARNPVDWYPWGEEAFRRAREEDKPVFLSVGYSSCHWCHVMEHESFEDPELAARMNEAFVNVKVDREERPDVDKVYMDAVQRMTGAGGWPMTVVMTPDQKPFFAGTYFPKRSRAGRPGMFDIVEQLDRAWKEDREKIREIGTQVVAELQRMNNVPPGEALTAEALDQAYQAFLSRYDRQHGGFSGAPKFPLPHNLSFLLRYARRNPNSEALNMVQHTLQQMRRGGMYDHLGFGFHRYATDARWLLPHFEKMLYDQALHALAYLEAYQLTGKEAYADTAREIFTYVLRDMTREGGGFYSAEDADSEGVEGKFYVWTPAELGEVLAPEDVKLFRQAYDVRDNGNFREESTGETTGASVLHRPRRLEDLARANNLHVDDLRTRLEAARLNLYAEREKRVHPFKDDKILTDWNGLMLAALARGARVLDSDRYREAAVKTADFILAELTDEEGRLLKRYRGGEAGLPAHLDDYAFLAWGLVELYDATFDPRYLAEAKRLADLMLDWYWDGSKGGFFLTADDGEELLVRGKDVFDGAIPSGNSVAALVLYRLARLTGHTDYEDYAERTMRAFAAYLSRDPSIAGVLLQALDFREGPSHEVVIVGDPEAGDTRSMLEALGESFRPNTVVLVKEPGSDELNELAPFTREMEMVDEKATAYVCRNFACELPTTDPGKMLSLLSDAGTED